MKKIPTVFVRDMETKLVTEQVTPGCEWVLAGEGVATIKWDGSCCMVRDGKLFKRYDAKRGRTPPPNFEPSQEPDAITGHWPGWVPVGSGPADQYHREAWELVGTLKDGTYELVGPKVNGNPEGMGIHILVRHGVHPIGGDGVVLTFEGIRAWLEPRDIEGLVFYHHRDGRMAKIKKKDYGLKR